MEKHSSVDRRSYQRSTLRQCAPASFWALMFVFLLPLASYGQASITGTVKDASGAVLPGVTVEAASPALIEGVRSTTTDSNGNYRINTLRPGTYAVTLTLPGFNTVKRDGLELSGDFVATLNMEMRVGSIEETIVVTGESPIVDVQSASQQRVVQKDIFDAIPTGRAFQNLGFLIPGMTQTTAGNLQGAQDVGGARGTAEAKNIIHGSRASDQMYYVGGLLNLSGVTSTTGGSGPNIPDMGAIQEVVVTYSAGLGDAFTGGVGFNLVPREGGNRFSGGLFASYGSEDTQGKNLDDKMRAAGLTQVNAIKMNLDINPSVGGPIKKNKLWFFGSFHQVYLENYAAGSFYNRNVPTPVFNFQAGVPGQPNYNEATAAQLNTWTVDPDPTERGYDPGRHTSTTIRLTWQATEKNKVTGFFEGQRRGNASPSPTTSPEAATYLIHSPQHYQANWSTPVTNRLLLEAGGKWVRRTWCQCYATDPRFIPVTEQTTGLTYRNSTAPNQNLRHDHGETFTVKYVTGSHDLKTGFVNNAAWETRDQLNQPLVYRLNNGVPNQLTQTASPWNAKIESDFEFGAYVQDKWTMGRATFSGAVRYDFQDRFYPEQHLGPTLLTPTRDKTYPLTREVGWKDLTPRAQAAFDVFGNGRTALKMSAGKYVTRAFFGYPDGNPVNSLALSTTRAWTDVNRNFVVDCDLTNNGAQTVVGGDICGVVANSRFGELTPQSAVDPNIKSGWGKRQYNWEFSTSAQQQLTDRMSINVGVFRRIYGNFVVQDNLAVGPEDYTTFSLQIPTDSRLPDSGGTLPGLVDVNANKFGQVSNLITLASNYGKQTEHYDGFDVSIDARTRSGLTFQGGISSGRIVTDNCEIVAKLPELGVAAKPYCHDSQSIKYATQSKFLGTYTIPKWDVLLSGTYQLIPGGSLAANYAVPAATVAAALGRPVSGNPANVTINIVRPNTLYADWINQLDLRIGKAIKAGQTRARVSVDLFNALNDNAVQVINSTYGPVWMRPTTILTARFVKFSLQFDF